MGQYALALTLGHNASAVAIRDGQILGGYEEERFTLKKADSAFPIQSIKALREMYDLPPDTDICVSHWFLDGNLHDPSVTKYWHPQTLHRMFPNSLVHSIDFDGPTHHDAHALSAEVFAGKDFASNYHVYVMDGFGTAGECVTVYEVGPVLKKVRSRVFGFKYSMGMFYQYATAFCGMKMHNHEYKMLAYETRITLLPVNIDAVNDYIDEFSNRLIHEINQGMSDGTMDPVLSLDALVKTNLFVEKTLSAFLAAFGYNNADIQARRILVSYFAQRHVENMVMSIHRSVRPDNLIVVGGLFYNVKLNHLLCNATPGKFCAMPLAGDQGAGLGVYQYYFGNLKWPDHLFWGHRTLDYEKLIHVDGIAVADEYTARLLVQKELETVGFVNIVRGSMEYGPRALCHTTTLAIPTGEIGAMVNKMNERTNEMPFALVMTPIQAEQMFIDVDRIHKSLEYMIMAREFKPGKWVDVEGGAHYYPLSDTYTCRPQVTRDPFMVALLDKYGPLINTSWNFHGVPIVYDTDQIIYTHNKERAALPEINFKTIIVKE